MPSRLQLAKCQRTFSAIPEWEPVNTRLIGEETEITLQTLNTDSLQLWAENGGGITIPVVDNKFTIPAAVNPGAVEWRVIMKAKVYNIVHGSRPAQEPGWEVDEFALPPRVRTICVRG